LGSWIIVKDGRGYYSRPASEDFAMNVKLTPHSESLLRESLARGGHRTLEQVVELALEILVEKEAQPESSTSILQLQGLGKEIWLGTDAQENMDQEHTAWNG
jgi:hypothetical protein